MASKQTPKLTLSFKKSSVDLLNAQKTGTKRTSISEEEKQIAAVETGQDKLVRKRTKTPKAAALVQKDHCKKSKTPKAATLVKKDDGKNSKTPEPVKRVQKTASSKSKTPDRAPGKQNSAHKRSQTPSAAAASEDQSRKKSKTPVPIVQPVEKPEPGSPRILHQPSHTLKLEKMGQFIANSVYDSWPKHQEGRHKGLPNCSDFWSIDKAEKLSSEEVYEQQRDLYDFASRIPTLKNLLGKDFVLEEPKKTIRRRRKSVTPAVQVPAK